MRSLIIVLCGIMCTGISALAQTNNDIRNQLIYQRDFTGGLSWTTNGYNAFARFGKIQDAHSSMFFECSIQSLRHPKEYKSLNSQISGAPSPRKFVYGKENSLIGITASWGVRQILAEKAEKSGVELSFIYSGGFTVGILKPYELELIYNDPANPGYVVLKTERYNNTNANTFLDPNSIYGYSGFSAGFNKISILPGIHVKGGFNADIANFDDKILQIELGAQIEAFPKKVPVMIIDDNRWLWPSVYLSVLYGKRY